MNIITRQQWGARYPDGAGNAQLPASELWLHHSAGVLPDLVAPFDDDYAAVRAIEAEGQRRFNQGMPYTFLVTPAGLIFEGHSVGRLGAHTAGRNGIARGICLVGNFEVHTPPAPMLTALVWLLIEGHTRRWWTRRTLNGGHRDTKATACPGRHAYALIGDINRRAMEDDDMPTPAEFWDHLISDPYVGPKGEKADPKHAKDLLGWAATHSAYSKEQVIALRAELAALRAALPNMVAEEVRAALEENVVDVDVTVRDRVDQ